MNDCHLNVSPVTILILNNSDSDLTTPKSFDGPFLEITGPRIPLGMRFLPIVNGELGSVSHKYEIPSNCKRRTGQCQSQAAFYCPDITEILLFKKDVT